MPQSPSRCRGRRNELAMLLFLLLFTGATALYENCDLYQELEPNKPYYIYSPGYPQKYQPGSSCRWYAVSPPGTQIFLSCENVDLPQRNPCGMDRVAVSRTGDFRLTDASLHCGRGGFMAVSVSNRMNIVLQTHPASQPGSLLCNIGVQKVSEPTPNPGHCECGWRNMVRIVGGSNTGVNEYPMMAGLVDSVKRELYCGATIISQSYALTAAHCLTDKQPFTIGLVVGEHDTSRGSDTNSTQIMLIDRIIIHPNYETVTHKNDIGLVHVINPISFNQRVGPVCLPFINYKQSLAGEAVDVLGWGSTDFGGANSKILQRVSLNVLTTAQCRTAYPSGITEKHICTFKKGQDACQSDSGGPLLWDDPQSARLKLVGVISYGIGCASQSPGVNTRVASYLPWIAENADDEFCVK